MGQHTEGSTIPRALTLSPPFVAEDQQHYDDQDGLTEQRVELLISCTELVNLDDFSKTDPMCVVFVKQFGQWKELARTEAVRDQLNPKVLKGRTA